MKVFYVTMLRDSRVAWLAGPFETKAEAETFVRPAQEAAIAVNAFHHFDSFGVTGIERTQDALDMRPWFKGKLNAQIGLAA